MYNAYATHAHATSIRTDVSQHPWLACSRKKGGHANGQPVCHPSQRVGYFCVDETSTKESPIFNRVVALKEDRAKVAIKKP
jgi:hypothetical protein